MMPHIIYSTGTEQCTCCGKNLKGKIAYLELDARTGTYHNPSVVLAENSQGFFPFGISCAKKMLKQKPPAQAAKDGGE